MSREQVIELSASDVDFLAAMVKRLCAHFGYPIPDLDNHFIVGIAASLISGVLIKLESKKRNAPDLEQQEKDAARYRWIRDQYQKPQQDRCQYCWSLDCNGECCENLDQCD